MKNTLFYPLLISIIIGLFSCSPCKRFFTYKTKTVNIKGITIKLKKAGEKVGDIGVGEIIIKPENVKVSDRLKELDLRQFAICQQMKGLSKKDTLKKKLIAENVTIYRKMFEVSKNQDSVVNTSIKQILPILPDNAPHPRPTKETLLQEKETAKKSAKELLTKLDEILLDEKQTGSDNLQQIVKIFIELNNKYSEIKKLNEQLNIANDNSKWDEMIKKNNEEIKRREKR